MCPLVLLRLKDVMSLNLQRTGGEETSEIRRVKPSVQCYVLLLKFSNVVESKS